MFRSLTYGEVLQPIVTEVEQQIKQIHEKIDERITRQQDMDTMIMAGTHLKRFMLKYSGQKWV